MKERDDKAKRNNKKNETVAAEEKKKEEEKIPAAKEPVPEIKKKVFNFPTRFVPVNR